MRLALTDAPAGGLVSSPTERGRGEARNERADGVPPPLFRIIAQHRATVRCSTTASPSHRALNWNAASVVVRPSRPPVASRRPTRAQSSANEWRRAVAAPSSSSSSGTTRRNVTRNSDGCVIAIARKTWTAASTRSLRGHRFRADAPAPRRESRTHAGPGPHRSPLLDPNTLYTARVEVSTASATARTESAAGPPAAISSSAASSNASRTESPCSLGRPTLDKVSQHRYVTTYRNSTGAHNDIDCPDPDPTSCRRKVASRPRSAVSSPTVPDHPTDARRWSCCTGSRSTARPGDRCSTSSTRSIPAATSSRPRSASRGVWPHPPSRHCALRRAGEGGQGGGENGHSQHGSGRDRHGHGRRLGRSRRDDVRAAEPDCQTRQGPDTGSEEDNVVGEEATCGPRVTTAEIDQPDHQ